MDLNDLRVFVIVARHQSFTRAAKELGIGKSTASERVQALEAQLGTRLLNRTTRRLGLTEAGAELLQRGSAILSLAEEAQHVVTRSTRAAVGRLRVSVPFTFGLKFLTDVVAGLLSKHQRLEIDFVLEDRDVDLVAERFDAAVRIGVLDDASVVARRIGQSRRVTVASPGYVARHGRPGRPDDLRGHECLRYSHQRPLDRWVFGDQTVRVEGRFETNNGDALAEAACFGLGIAWLPDFVVLSHVRQGRLVVLLDDLCRDFAPIHVVFPSRAYRTLKEELFAEAVIARLQQDQTMASV